MPPEVKGGVTYLPLKVREGEEMNACSHSSAEISTFQGDTAIIFRDWKINPNSYVEVRLKAPSCLGVGASAWLYGPRAPFGQNFPCCYNEIDFFEMYGGNPSEFQTNFHYSAGRVPVSHNPWYFTREQDPDRVSLIDISGTPINLGSHFLTYGVDLNEDDERVDIYVNNTWVSWKSLYKTCGQFKQFKRFYPYNLIISVGSATADGGFDVNDCNDLPAYLEIDYVRVYQKSGTQAIKYHEGTTGEITFCTSGGGQDYAVSYYPGAQYSWSSHPGINITNPGPNDDWNHYWITVEAGAPVGIHNLTLTVSFPSGYTESYPLTINVISNSAPLPGPISESISYYSAEVAFYVTKQTGTKGYEWQINGGPWVYESNTSAPYNFYPGTFIPQSSSEIVNVCVRSVSSCGNEVSGSICQEFSLNTECVYCLQIPSTPSDVELYQISEESCRYGLRVTPSVYSTEYLWSFDQTEWALVQNDSSNTNNKFGDFLCGSDTFDIFIRAKNDYYVSGTYTKPIALPPGEGTCGNLPFNSNNTGNQIKKLKSPIGLKGTPEVQTLVVINSLGQIVRKSNQVNEPDRQLMQGLTSGIYFIHYLGFSGIIVNTRKVAYIRLN